MKNLLLKISIIVICALVLNAASASAFAAVGCTLNDPDRDIKRIFPESTGYKTEFISIEEVGGEELGEKIEKRLGDKFEPNYETIDVAYAFYTVLKGKDIIGRMHGVNQKGTYGGMQLILSTDTEGVIKDFYYQKISSPESKKFRDKDFTSQFTGLTLGDFYGADTQGRILDPSAESSEDFRNTLRGLKKNLILLDEFKMGNKYEQSTINDEVK